MSIKWKKSINLIKYFKTVCFWNGLFQILLYDIRSRKPYLVKDHNYELPIKSIRFQEKEDIVLSMDKRIVKMWDRNTVSFINYVISLLEHRLQCVSFSSCVVCVGEETKMALFLSSSNLFTYDTACCLVLHTCITSNLCKMGVDNSGASVFLSNLPEINFAEYQFL